MEIEFINPQEIRMGSPYNVCQIKFSEETIFNLEKASWQDKCAYNSDNSKIALVKWNTKNNQPAFQIVVLDFATGKRFDSQKIAGCLKSLEFKNDSIIRIDKFVHNDKAGATESSENYIEEIEINEFI